MSKFIPDTGPISFVDVETYALAGLPDAVSSNNNSGPYIVNDPNYNGQLPSRAWVFAEVGSGGPAPFVLLGNTNHIGLGCYSTMFPISQSKFTVDPTITASLDNFRGKGALYKQQGFEFESSGQNGVMYRMKNVYTATQRRPVEGGDLLIGTPPTGFACAMRSFSVTDIGGNGRQLRSNWAVWDANNPTVTPSATITSAFTSTNLKSCPCIFIYGGDGGGSIPSGQYIFSYKTGGVITTDAQIYQTVPSQPTGFYNTANPGFISGVDAGTGSWSTNGMFGAPLNTFVQTGAFTDTTGEVTGTVNGRYQGNVVQFGTLANPFRGINTATSSQAGTNPLDWSIHFLNDF
jgi:hypothetical protein